MAAMRSGYGVLRVVPLFLLLLLTSFAVAEKTIGGIGLAVVPTSEGELVVLKVIEKSPAAAAGMRPGDLIVQVDDQPLRGSDFTEVTPRYLWGEAGKPVQLKYLRPGREGKQTVTLKRIPMDSGSDAGRGGQE